MGMGKVKKLFASSEVAMAMLLVQIFTTGLQILSRVILGQGTFIFALMTYRNVVAAICVAPFAFYFERLASLCFDKFCVTFISLCFG